MDKEIADLRRQVLSTARRMAQTGLVASVWGNVSARVGASDRLIVTPSGMDYTTMQEEDLVLVSLATGSVIEGKRKPTSELLLHRAIYQARPDVRAVIHTHSLYASACAVVRCPIPPLMEDMVQVVGGGVPVAPYALPGTEELAINAVKALAGLNAVLLANHGAVGVGETLEEALRTCILLEKGAQIYAIAKTIGSPHTLSEEDVRYLRQVYKTSYGQGKSRGGHERNEKER